MRVRLAAVRTAVLMVLTLLVSVVSTARPAGATVSAGSVDMTYKFVTSKGWVHPGDSFPVIVTLTNKSGSALAGVSVTIPPVDGMTFTSANSLDDEGPTDS